MRPFGPRLPWLLCVALASSACRSGPFGHAKVDSPARVPAVMEQAQAEEQAGRRTQAIDLLYAARDVSGLTTDQRIQVETLLEQIAERRILELEQQGSGSRELEALSKLGLPTPISVSAGVAAARMLHQGGSSYKAYKLLADLETRFPVHPLGAAAGEITAAAGLQMTTEPRRFLGFFTRRDEGIEALEWLVITYPTARRCNEAYFRLGELYAADRRFKLAVQRYDELVAYHPESANWIEAQARVPRMRLAGLESPEYDRRELNEARAELERWLERHSGQPQEAQVRRDYGDCLRRLVLSDQGIARFYLRIGRPFGAQFHAQRALDIARLTGDGELTAACESLLQRADRLQEEVDRDGDFRGFLDRPDAEEKPPESIQTPTGAEQDSPGAQP